MNEWAIPDLIRNIQLEIIGRNSELIRGRSDLPFLRTERITIKAAQWDLGPGRVWQNLPPLLENKRCFRNIKNDDEKCFVYSLAAYLLQREELMARLKKWKQILTAVDKGEQPKEIISLTLEDMQTQTDQYEIPASADLSNPFTKGNHNPNRASLYRPHFERFGLNEIECPVKPSSVPELEDKLKLKINIFSFFDLEGRCRFPLYVSNKPYKRQVDLLYWNEHYALITNFSAFLRDLCPGQHTVYFCRFCFGHHRTQEALDHHKLFCKRINWCNQIYILPEEGTRLKFKNIKYQQECPFAIYGDFECRTKPINEKKKRTTFFSEARTNQCGIQSS